MARCWSVFSFAKIYLTKVVVSFEKLNKHLQRCILLRFAKVFHIKAVVSSEKFWKDIFSHGGGHFSKVWQSFAKIYSLPRFARNYIPKVVVSSQHTCLTLATLYLPSIGPAPVNLLRSGPGLVTVNADNSWKSTSDESWSVTEQNRCQHIRRQYETGHQVVAKVLATDNSSFTQVQNERYFN